MPVFYVTSIYVEISPQGDYWGIYDKRYIVDVKDEQID